jgi:translation elongation factor P/translation initiation factor 5A
MIDTVTNIKKDMLIRHEDGLFIVALCNHNVTARGAGSVIVKLKNIETGANLEIKYPPVTNLKRLSWMKFQWNSFTRKEINIAL